MTEKRCKTYKIKMKLQIKYVDLIHIIHITYSSGHGYYYYDQNQHAVSGSSAGHQFRSHIPHQIPQVHFLPQVIPPPQAHQRAHQVHQPLHNLNVLQYPNFSQINNTQSHFPVTSQSSSYFNPTTSNPSPTSPCSISFFPPYPSYYPFLSHDINTKATTQVHTLFNCSLFNFPIDISLPITFRHIPTKLIKDVLIHLLLLSYESSTPASEQWTWMSPDW